MMYLVYFQKLVSEATEDKNNTNPSNVGKATPMPPPITPSRNSQENDVRATVTEEEVKPEAKKMDVSIDDVKAFKNISTVINDGQSDKPTATAKNLDIAQELVRRVSLEAASEVPASKNKNSGEKVMGPPQTVPSVVQGSQSVKQVAQNLPIATTNQPDDIKTGTGQISKQDVPATDGAVDPSSQQATQAISQSKQTEKSDAKSDTKLDTKPDAKHDDKTDDKLDAKSDAKPDTKSDAKTDVKSDVKTSTKTDTKPVTSSAPSSHVTVQTNHVQTTAPTVPTTVTQSSHPVTQASQSAVIPPPTQPSAQPSAQPVSSQSSVPTSTQNSHPTQVVPSSQATQPATNQTSTVSSGQTVQQVPAQPTTQPQVQGIPHTTGVVTQPSTQSVTQSSALSTGNIHPQSVPVTAPGSKSVEPQASLDLTSGQTSHENTMTLTRQQRNMMDFENLKQKLVQLSGSQKNSVHPSQERPDEAKTVIHSTSAQQQVSHTIPAAASNVQMQAQKSQVDMQSYLPQTHMLQSTYSNQMYYPEISAHSGHSASMSLLPDHTSSYNMDNAVMLQQLQAALGHAAPSYPATGSGYNVPHYGSAAQIPLSVHHSLQQLQQLAVVIGQLQQQYPLLHSSLAALLNQQVSSVLLSQPPTPHSQQTSSFNPLGRHYPSHPDHLSSRGRAPGTKLPGELATLEKALIEKLHMHHPHPHPHQHRRLHSQISHESVPPSPNSMYCQSPPQPLQTDSPLTVPRSPDQIERSVSPNPLVQNMMQSAVASQNESQPAVESQHDVAPEGDCAKTDPVGKEPSRLPVAKSAIASKSRFSVTLVEDDMVAPPPGTPAKEMSPAKVSRQNSLEKNSKATSPTKPRLGSPMKSGKNKEMREVTRKGRFHVTTVIKDPPVEQKNAAKTDSSKDTNKDDALVSKPLSAPTDVLPARTSTISAISSAAPSETVSTSCMMTSATSMVGTHTNAILHKTKFLHHSDSNPMLSPPRTSTIPVSIRRRQSVPALHLQEHKHALATHSQTSESNPALPLVSSSCLVSSSPSLVHDSTLCTLYEVCYLKILTSICKYCGADEN